MLLITVFRPPFFLSCRGPLAPLFRLLLLVAEHVLLDVTALPLAGWLLTAVIHMQPCLQLLSPDKLHLVTAVAG